jgi:hypothetical protein
MLVLHSPYTPHLLKGSPERAVLKRGVPLNSERFLTSCYSVEVLHDEQKVNR